jgi:transposase
MGYVRGESRDQSQLFPLSLDDLIPADHPCRVIDAFVGYLDLAALGFGKARPAATGRPAYSPSDLLKLYLYGYLNRVRSSRRLERECQRNMEVMWLLNRLVPDHKTIAEFRRHNGKGVRRAGVAFVRFCHGAGLIKGEWIAIDGSKFQAVASYKSVADQRRLQQEHQRLEQKIGLYLDALDQADVHEQELDVAPDAVRAALVLLQQEQAYVAALLEQLEGREESRVILGEPEARLMKNRGPSYNLQSAVDAEHALIVSHALTNEVSDNRSLQPMSEAAAEVLGKDTFNVVADAGYSNGEQVAALEARGIVPHGPANRAVNNQDDGRLFDRSRFAYDDATDTLCCPAGKTLLRKQLQRTKKIVIYTALVDDCANCPLKSQCTTRRVRLVSRHLHEDALNRMMLRTTAEVMRLRRSTVEHPFATLKYNILEKPRLLMRGLWGAGTEMALATLVYNMKRVMKVLGNRALQARLASC